MTDLRRRHDQIMGMGAPLFYEEPLELVRGDGVWIYDTAGDRYLDLYNNVPCVGHANPRVVQAMAEQAGQLNVHSRYLHPNVVDYAERLVGLHHDGIESLVIACSGTEALEIAVMMARAATGKRGIICTDATYHGNSAEISQLTHLPVGRARGAIRSIATPQTFRPIDAGLSDQELCDRHIEQLGEVIAAHEASGEGFAAMVFCSILANEGLPNVPDGWFARAVELVHDAGGLVIADEVQAGFARSGQWWGYQTNDFEPDIVCMGKPMGNGLPISGVASSHDLVSGFRTKQRYFNTFASSPVQAAAGNAVIAEIVDRGLVAQVAEVGGNLRDRLSAVRAQDDRIGDVRGVGLFIGLDWVKPRTTEPDVAGAARAVEALKARKILVGKAGQFGNVVKIRPPLVFGHEHGDLFFDAFSDVLDELS